jgi:hypothetical protein
MLVNYMAMWSILLLFRVFCGHSVYFVVIWVLFSRFGMLHQEQSGNPDSVADLSSRAQANFGGILSPATLAV